MYSIERLVQAIQVPHPPNTKPPTALVNNDVKPIEMGRSTWGRLDLSKLINFAPLTNPRVGGVRFASLWATVAFNMSGFQIGSSLLVLGALIGHICAALYVVAMSIPGAHYQISFPVSNRVSWGYFGSIFVILNRIMITVVSTGIQNYLSGLIMYCLLRSLWPSIDNVPNHIPASSGLSTPVFIGVAVYFIVQFPLLLIRPKQVALLFYAGGVFGFLTHLCLVIWACATMGSAGFGATLKTGSSLSGSSLGWMFIYSISITISSVTGGSVAICDFTRFSSSVSACVWSQLIGWFPTWLSSCFGILTIAATQIRYGEALWSVPSLLMTIQSANNNSATRVAVFFCSLGFLASQLARNAGANTFAGGADISALFPKFVNIRRGQVITACLGLVINPWYLLSSAVVFVTVFSSYSVFVQPFMVIMIAQYFVVQKGRFKVADLYIAGPKSVYWYNYGVNWRAIVSWCCGIFISLPGFLATVGVPLSVSTAALEAYYLCGLTGALISFSLTIILDYFFPISSQKAFVQSITKQEARCLKEEYI
ncbi:allantoin permease [Xylariales sp. PMI_506]|nr:allantoin permease [Xylariales sp. PMI_506]